MTAICQALADAGVGAWRPSGPAYTSAEVGIFYGAIGASPDRAIGVARYMRDDFVPGDRYATTTLRVQVRVRGPKGVVAGADDLADAVDAALQGLSRVGGLNYIERQSLAPLGPDGNGRQELTLNYLVCLED